MQTPPVSGPVSGKVALVTGGSRGIGLAIAAALTRAGASVVIIGREPSHLDAAISTLPHGRAHALAVDVRDPAAADLAVAAAVDRFGGLDVLVNNAGIGLSANVVDTGHDAWREVFETNVSGVFYCCRAAIPRLRERGGGWIINISSLAATRPFPGGAAYCASKAALNAFSEALMQEVRHDGIRVSTVLPGSVSTGFSGRGQGGTADWKLAPEDVAEVVVNLLGHHARSLPSRVEIRPSRPKGA